MKLDASGTLTDSIVMGGRLPELSFECTSRSRRAHRDAPKVPSKDSTPASLQIDRHSTDRSRGTVDAHFSVCDVNAPMTPDAITADGRATLTSSAIGGLKIDSAELEGKYDGQVGDVTKLDVAGPTAKAHASGRIALDRASNSNLKYHVDAVNLEDLAKLAGQGSVAGSAILEGTLTGNAASLEATGTLDGSDLSYEDNNALDLNSQYTVTVPDLQFANVRVKATTNATFVKIGGAELNSLTATTTYDQKALDFSTNLKEKTRELDASGQVIFHPDHQEIHLPALAVRAQGVEWHMAPGSQATVKYARERVDFENVRLVSADQSLDVNGTLTLGTATPVGAIQVKANNVDLKQLETLTLQDRGLTGRLNADASISGTAAAPDVKGTVQVTNGGFQSYHYDSLSANVDYKGARLGIDATLNQSATESITAKGSVPTSLFTASPSGEHVEPTPEDAVDLQIKSSVISLALLQGVTNQLTNVAGTLEADVHLTGSAQDPHAQGFVDIKNGAFGIPAAGETFTGLTTRIELKPETVQVREFQLLDRHGEKLRVAGELAVHARQLGDVNVTIESDNFEVLNNELGDVQVQTALKLTGELRRPQLVGDVHLDAARVEVDQVLSLFYTPYSEESLAEVVSAERTVEGSGSAEDATKSGAGEGERISRAARGRGEGRTGSGPGSGAVGTARGALDGYSSHRARQPRRARQRPPARRTDRRGARRSQRHPRRRSPRSKEPECARHSRPDSSIPSAARTTSRAGDSISCGTAPFDSPGTADINPLLDIRATRQIPNTGVEARDSHHRDTQSAAA